jgi:ankyrin
LPTTKALLNNGADPNITHPTMQITPLHIAASNDHTFVVRELIAHRANLNAMSGKGFTPLIMACSQGYVDVTALLIEAGGIAVLVLFVALIDKSFY